MPVLKTFTQQPTDRQDYDVDFNDWLTGFSPVDAISGSPTIEVSPGITLLSSEVSSGVVKVWLEGGTSGHDYKISVTVGTIGGRVKQVEIVLKVRED